jgi:redox-sensitive bicupin YhaK (pirin superfamily)
MKMQPRLVTKVIQPQSVTEGAGVLVRRSFPSRELNYPDPFLLFDHFGSDNPQDYLAGFPLHPHRGIETVTYMLSGTVDHRDSLGNSGAIGAGDVQWMTAGEGILHEEMPKPVRGKMEGFQLWVNLPSQIKMTHPHYQEINAADVPLAQWDNGVSVRVIAGCVENVRGPVVGIAADPVYLDVHLAAEARFSLPTIPGHTVMAYLYHGRADFYTCAEDIVDRTADELPVPAQFNALRLLVFGDGDVLTACAGPQSARFMVMMGKPTGEPIVRYGSFVMNTEQEIAEALQDLRNGTFAKK